MTTVDFVPDPSEMGGSIDTTSVACSPRCVGCIQTVTRDWSATELRPKFLRTLACSRMSAPPSSFRMKP